MDHKGLPFVGISALGFIVGRITLSDIALATGIISALMGAMYYGVAIYYKIKTGGK
jgi:hypothetical protein